MPLPKLKDITWVTTDCYGTLIDWEKGILESFHREAKRDGFSFEEEPFMNRFFEVQAEIIRGSYELYAEVLRRAAVKAAKEIGWELEPSRAQFLPDSVPQWAPFREANAAMDRLRKRYEVGIVSNIDDKLLGVSRRHLRTELDLVVTAQQVRSYKPDPAHFKECARRIGGKKGWLHIASGYETDVAPALKMNVPVIWVNRSGEKLEGRKAPSATVKNLRDAAKRLGAGAEALPGDPADRAMVARAHERFAAERRRAKHQARAHGREGALPNLIIIGGLKCGTTSLHHYLNLHPEIAMSRPKELNFFVSELNWPLGRDWYAGHFDPSARIRGESSPHYTNRPSFNGVPGRMRELLGSDVRLVYVVRDPIDRMLSHYLHNVGGGYEDRSLADALSDPESSLRRPQPLLLPGGPLPRGVRGREGSDRRPRGAEGRRDRARCAASSSSLAWTRISLRSSSSASGRPAWRRPAAGSASWTGRSGSPACER